MKENAQTVFLQSLSGNSQLVFIFLKNGIKLQGHIAAFDDRVILFKSATKVQMVFVHAIATVLAE